MVKKRIAGKQLSQSVNDEVILLGTVTKKSSSGKNIELKTTDGAFINISLPEPLSDNIDGFVEVHGTALSKSTVSCKDLIRFPTEICEGFDADQYNELMAIYNVLGNKKWRISEDDLGF